MPIRSTRSTPKASALGFFFGIVVGVPEKREAFLLLGWILCFGLTQQFRSRL